MKSATPTQRPYPTKLFMEPTTRCNFKCAMCVKQAQDNEIAEGDLSPETFEALSPAFDRLETLIFSGIGEPLLHPQIERFVALARERMPEPSRIGLQTNGYLLDATKAESLREAGLDTVCLSLDAFSPEMFQQIRTGGEFGDIERAFHALRQAASAPGDSRFKFGIEFVLMEKNLSDFPKALAWAARQGASFAIGTHLLAYDPAVESEILHSPNTDASRDLYRSWRARATERIPNRKELLQLRYKYFKTPADKERIDFVDQMKNEAWEQEIPFHLHDLQMEDAASLERVSETFEEARRTADALGIELTMPALYPKFDRRCDFLEEGSTFVSWQGTIHACHFQWHQYAYFLNGSKCRIPSRSFGTLSRHDILEIWNEASYVSYREKVLRYNYPFCGNCNMGSCGLITAKTFRYDCYSNEVPCGHCPWCLGLLKCLQ
ncbi:MAG: radical SAM/SPASM family putative metalloenzyme maturase [Proteobacteria bacterium]|nr:radical SAM/SPASM family putative metalloenzyme maturase [Pseudomonadota bacterium]